MNENWRIKNEKAIPGLLVGEKVSGLWVFFYKTEFEFYLDYVHIISRCYLANKYIIFRDYSRCNYSDNYLK